ncbi:hypothetical protein BDV98DRAFT_177095 [Pterulicium gracile]|uniref:Uncharacterized protein n=1 Tax=Pterulicium gracile TaxID=1884261 RepID=A0A5C3QB70_9AGAR|nr:hypothetical protein BDV98DRAFT_177095 [Pterula gracilis]
MERYVVISLIFETQRRSQWLASVHRDISAQSGRMSSFAIDSDPVTTFERSCSRPSVIARFSGLLFLVHLRLRVPLQIDIRILISHTERFVLAPGTTTVVVVDLLVPSLGEREDFIKWIRLVSFLSRCTSYLSGDKRSPRPREMMQSRLMLSALEPVFHVE